MKRKGVAIDTLSKREKKEPEPSKVIANRITTALHSVRAPPVPLFGDAEGRVYVNRVTRLSSHADDARGGVHLSEILAGRPKGTEECPRSPIRHVLASSFCTDVEWFVGVVEAAVRGQPTFPSVDMILENREKRGTFETLEFGTRKVQAAYPAFPKRKDGNDEIGCMHPKLILVATDHHIRVVISSGNLYREEWEEFGQAIWMQDFSMHTATTSSSQSVDSHLRLLLDPFGSQLSSFLLRLLCGISFADCMEDRWYKLLLAADFSTARGALVTSVAGFHFHCPTSQPPSDPSFQFVGVATTPVELEQTQTAHKYLASIGKVDVSQGCQEGEWDLQVEASHSDKPKTDIRNFFSGGGSSSKPKTASNTAPTALLLTHDGKTIARVKGHDAKPIVDLVEKGAAKVVAQIARSNQLNSRAGRIFVASTQPHVHLGISLSTTLCKNPQESDKVKGEIHNYLRRLIGRLTPRVGLVRMRELLGQHTWPTVNEDGFYYHSPSLGRFMEKKWTQSFDEHVCRHSASVAGPGIIYPSQSHVKKYGHLTTMAPSCILSVPDKMGQILQNEGRLYHVSSPQYRHLNGSHNQASVQNELTTILAHAKVLIRRFTKIDGDSQTSAKATSSYGWMYVGSHNYSPSAWGRVYEDGISLNNFELGVLMMEPAAGSEGFDNRFAVPFLVHPQAYVDSDKVWSIEDSGAMHSSLPQLLERTQRWLAQAVSNLRR